MNITNFNQLSQLYNSLSDTESKDIFVNRFIYNITSDFNNINEIVDKYVPLLETCYSQEDKQIFNDTVDKIKQDRKIIIYGAGKASEVIYSMIDPDSVECFCDINKDKQNIKLHNKSIISMEELIERDKSKYIIILAIWNMYQPEVIQKLLDNNFEKEFILDGTKFCNFKGLVREQYFDTDIIKFDDEEIFVDCGCYDFTSSKILLEKCSTVKKVFAYEPDPINIKKCERYISENNNVDIKIVNKGLWSDNKQLQFNTYGGGGSCIAKEGNINIDVVSLDNELFNERITFIKMDIEGAELAAIEGAKNIIMKYKPKLAISIYHKPEDLIEIIEILKAYVPEYRLYLRHYSNCSVDTVLYAVV